ncbi:unnamed protein product [Lactuca saligna]|uniref:Uncharacterized protein n=1 Tax=Lactuca saligna TaxID=75948 RepID=A0AA36DY72_LACSI|nr:unnamed protein product [Lactuca saligna]
MAYLEMIKVCSWSDTAKKILKSSPLTVSSSLLPKDLDCCFQFHVYFAKEHLNVLMLNITTLRNISKTQIWHEILKTQRLIQEKEFAEATYTPEAELDVYIDHQNDPILDWAENEVLSDENEEEDDNEEEDHKEEEDDNDEYDNLDDIIAYEHEVDEEVHTFHKTVGDDFLNKLLVFGKLSGDDEHNDGKDDKVVFPVHDENQEWDKMVPILGMKFVNPMQLKLCITNYAVKNGYDLWDYLRLSRKGCLQKSIDNVPDTYVLTS